LNDGKRPVSDLGIPTRGKAFIKHIETSENYANSPIVITPKTRDAIAKCQFTVVAVGEWERCDEPMECERPHGVDGIGSPVKVWTHPHNVRVGDWVLCRNRSWDVTPDPSVYVVRVDDILGKFVET
jgi:hypothetical protein